MPQFSRYDAFGEKTDGTGTVPNQYLFAGEQYDSALGDYYLRARYYDAETGRFIRRDTYEGGLGDPLSLHKYSYTHNNPINGTDPTGLYLITEATRQALEKDLQAWEARQAVVTLNTVRQQMVVVAGAVATAFAAALATSVSVARTLNRQFGIPVVVWGNDLPETTQHQFKALTGSGYTLNNQQGAPGQSNLISPLLMRTEPYPRRLPGSSSPWYYNYCPCAGTQGQGTVCDEYPYASTVQGGFRNYMNSNVSIKNVPASEQSLRGNAQGGRLGRFYQQAPIARVEDPNGLRNSIFLNLAVPSLGFSFWLDRQSNPHTF